MNKNELITKILELINKPNGDIEEGFYYFGYRGFTDSKKLKETYKIVIGHENNKKYEEYFRELYGKIVDKRLKETLSYENFKKNCENLIIEDKFNECEILKLIPELKEIDVFELKIIYGLKIKNKNVFKIGKYTFVNKNQIKTYLKNTLKFKLKNPLNKDAFEKIDEELKNDSDFVYLLFKYKSTASKKTEETNDKEVNELVHLIRFLSKNNNDLNNYIGLKPYNNFEPFNNCIYNATFYKYKNISLQPFPVYIDDLYKNNLSKRIFNLFLKKDKNNFESRILKAINWVSLAYVETNIEIAISEIAFAFETVLVNNNEVTTQRLAESYAFVNGNSVKERCELEDEFRNFYKIRCKIVHGNSSNADYTADKYYEMARNTIYSLLTKTKFKFCFKNQNLEIIIKKLKYK